MFMCLSRTKLSWNRWIRRTSVALVHIEFWNSSFCHPKFVTVGRCYTKVTGEPKRMKT